jgi:hypothetical protein
VKYSLPNTIEGNLPPEAQGRQSKMDYKEVYEAFVQDVKDHEVTVELDQGVFRHLVCAKPGTSIHSFEITTWPGYLAVTGDMGAFLFSRVNDMFEFFRTGKEPWMISFGYWAEKCQAVDRREGIREYSPETAKRALADWMTEWPDVIREQALEFLSPHMEYEHSLRSAAAQFSAETEDDAERYDFQDFFEVGLTEYTWHFIWCCYAILWTIEQYDRMQNGGAKGMKDRLKFGDIVINHHAGDGNPHKVLVFLSDEDRFLRCLALDGMVIEVYSLFCRLEKIGKLDLTDWQAAAEAIQGVRVAQEG